MAGKCSRRIIELVNTPYANNRWKYIKKSLEYTLLCKYEEFCNCDNHRNIKAQNAHDTDDSTNIYPKVYK